MRNNIPPEILDAIAALGFDIYQSSDPRWQSYCFFTDADAYREMIRGGDALRSDPYSTDDLAKAVALVAVWELEA